MTRQELLSLLREPNHISEEYLNDLYALSETYPFSAPLHLLLLKALYVSEDLRFASELKRRILWVPGAKNLFYLLKGEEFGLLGLYSREEERSASPNSTEETLDIIDSILQESKSPARASHIEEELPIYYIPEYDLSQPQSSDEGVSKELTEEEPKIQGELTSLNDVVEEKEGDKTSFELPAEDNLLTETLSKLYIKQGKYEQAKKIISSLHLQYPQKNSYFAEQIKFIDKLIINKNS